MTTLIMAVVVERCIRALPPAQGRALVLRYFEDLPHERIAAEMGITEANAQVMVHRGKRALAECLARLRNVSIKEP